MKRTHNHVSATPVLLLKKGKTSSRQHAFLGTPVEGLTGIPVDTPDSDDRPPRAIPETTQRRLEGFCLTTPLSLSQAAAAAEQETPTLGKDQPAQHDHPQQDDDDGADRQQLLQKQKQQQHHQQQQHYPSSSSHKQQQPQHMGPAGLTSGGRARHRLANISNLPPNSSLGAAAAAAGEAAAAACQSPAPPDSSGRGVQPMATGGTTGRSKQRRNHVFFHPGMPQLAPASGSRSGPPPAPSSAHGAAGAAAAARTPYPLHGGSSSLAACIAGGTPGSCGGAAGDDDDDCGFVLFTSQSYVRQSQPAISPSFAAGLSAAPEEEPTTTPSQDSREPRPSPSHGTISLATTATTGSMSFDLPQPLISSAAAAAGGGGAVWDCRDPYLLQQQQQDEEDDEFQQQQQLTGSQVTAPNAAPVRGAAAGIGSRTPADGLGMLPELEETTTPELEQIGIVASQEGGSQQQHQQHVLLLLGSGAAAAAGAVGSGSRALAAAAAAAAAGGGSSRGVARAGGAGVVGGVHHHHLPGSSGRGSRGPGVVCEEVTAKQMLFPVFRPRTERKCVILVRHGESTYNKQDAHGKSWSDPKIFDAPLTQRGRQQALAARERVSDMLRKHGHLGSTLWICSPLTRALETMTLAAPQVEALAAGQEVKDATARVVISSLIAEHCATSGDVGRPASQLRGKFPGLLPAMDDLQECWWFNPAPEDNPNCADTGVFNKVESIDSMRRRVSEFASWLRHRPEHVVVAFGHSTFWKYFANSRTRLRNCEVLQMWW